MDLLVDFAFFNEMREKLQLPFNVEEKNSKGNLFYTEQRLNFLYNAENVLFSEYCSDVFRESITEFFEKNLGKYEKVIAINTKGAYEEDFVLKILQEYESFDAAKTFLETKKVAKPYETNIEEWFEIIPGLQPVPGFVIFPFLEIFYSEHDKNKQILSELVPYYDLWLKNTNGYSSVEFAIWLSTNVLSELCSSVYVLQKLLASFEPAKTFQLLLEQIANAAWSPDKSESNVATLEEKNFVKKLVEIGAKEGVTLFLELTLLDDSPRKILFKTFEEKGLIIPTEENFEEIKALINDEIARFEIKLEHIAKAAEHGFDIAKFKQLAIQYKMPSSIINQFFEKEYPKFNFRSNKILQLLSTKESASAGAGYGVSSESSNPLFKYIVEYEKNDKITRKPYVVEVLEKTDPTALFVGKMLKCCQFYTGHSSRQAVIPVYTDENAALIVVRDVKDKNKIKGATFAWLGTKDGKSCLVLDSFEHLPEAAKSFQDFTLNLARILAEQGADLYVGNGGNTPKLNLDVVPLSVQPVSPEFKPYQDSSSVYKIPLEKFDVQTTSNTVDDLYAKVVSHCANLLTQMQKDGIANIFEIKGFVAEMLSDKQGKDVLARRLAERIDKGEDQIQFLMNLFEMRNACKNFIMFLEATRELYKELSAEKDLVIEFLAGIPLPEGHKNMTFRFSKLDYDKYKKLGLLERNTLKFLGASPLDADNIFSNLSTLVLSDGRKFNWEEDYKEVFERHPELLSVSNIGQILSTHRIFEDRLVEAYSYYGNNLGKYIAFGETLTEDSLREILRENLELITFQQAMFFGKLSYKSEFFSHKIEKELIDIFTPEVILLIGSLGDSHYFSGNFETFAEAISKISLADLEFLKVHDLLSVLYNWSANTQVIKLKECLTENPVILEYVKANIYGFQAQFLSNLSMQTKIVPKDQLDQIYLNDKVLSKILLNCDSEEDVGKFLGMYHTLNRSDILNLQAFGYSNWCSTINDVDVLVPILRTHHDKIGIIRSFLYVHSVDIKANPSIIDEYVKSFVAPFLSSVEDTPSGEAEVKLAGELQGDE